MDDELVTRETAGEWLKPNAIMDVSVIKPMAETIIALYDRAEQAEARVAELEAFAESVPGPVQESDNIWYCKQEWCGGSYQDAEHIKHHRACLWVKAQEALKGTQG